MLLKKNIPFSYVFGKIKYELIGIAIYTSVITAIYYYYDLTFLSIPLAIPTVLGTVISLLLGFRSNQAYDRWWEARHIWGAIVNDSRTLLRQVMSFTHDNYNIDDVRQFRQRMMNRQIGWCYALGRHLRKEDTIAAVEKYISKKELDWVKQIENTPSALVHEMGNDLYVALDNGWINSYQQVEIDRTVTRLTESMGKCERIKNTVFPSTYSLYIHLSLLLFIGMLPLAVIEYFGYMVIPVIVAFSACFLLIEKMAIHLQDPFENKPTDTPMTHIAGSIEKNLLQIFYASQRQQARQAVEQDGDSQVFSLAEWNHRYDNEMQQASYAAVGSSGSKKYFIL